MVIYFIGYGIKSKINYRYFNLNNVYMCNLKQMLYQICM